jgi:hypothetical protein
MLVGIDAESARAVLAGEVSPRLPNPVAWIVDQEVDICYLADGSVISKGQDIVYFGQRESGERYWYNTKVDKLITAKTTMGPDGKAIPRVTVFFRHDNREDTNTWSATITKVSELPDKEQFVREAQ